MHKYIIGIDTGGTFTDAVLVDRDLHEVVATAKRPTTHFNLAKGTGDALTELIESSGIASEQVTGVSVSSTLATNSVVENKGARVAIIVIGYVKHFKLPVKAVLFVKGGHTIKGKEEEPLDLEYLVSLVSDLKDEVDVYGVCSAMSIKNPIHELVAEKAIGMIDPKPVFCSHQISNQAGMQERAATAGLHAKLMPIMQKYVSGVQLAMEKHNLHCPMIVVGGDGKPLAAEIVVKQAGLTVASGPACTAHFGAARSNTDSLVIDVGGTTTDIAMIEDRQPLLALDGCQIGQWKTHVEAVDMHTKGVGGDSYVHLSHTGQLALGPSRVTPLSMAKGILSVEEWLGSDDSSKLIIFRPEAESVAQVDGLTALLTQHGQMTPAMIREKCGLGGVALGVQLEHLSRKQQIFECGFTPTDALHVLDIIDIGEKDLAVRGADILGGVMGLSAQKFARLVIGRTEELIENLVIDYVIQRYWNNSLTSFISTRKNHPVLGVDFSIKIPLIGLGAAARYFLPSVAANLGTTVTFPEHCEVGNAVGAAIICLSGDVHP